MTATDRPQKASRIIWKGKAADMPKLAEPQDVFDGEPCYTPGLSFDKFKGGA